MPRLAIKIFGRVQGINFRSFIYKHAVNLNLVGWVKNAGDGTVEAIFEGEKDNLKRIIELCRRGSLFSKVDKIDEEWEKAAKEFDEFVIKY